MYLSILNRLRGYTSVDSAIRHRAKSFGDTVNCAWLRTWFTVSVRYDLKKREISIGRCRSGTDRILG
jgi:hypothetical protein